MAKMKGAEILIECLKREGVKHIFGYPGGVILDIFDLLYDDPDIKLILTRHEQGATHAADGYARVSGKPGVVLVTSGPGATNTVTGIANAYMDSVPLVVFTGQVPTFLIGNDAFQEADIVGITRPCTKYNILVKDVKDLAKQVREAFYIATTGRPGPVLIDLPKDVTQGKTEFIWPEKIHIRSYNPTYEGNVYMIKKAAQEIAKAKKPVIIAGGGCIISNAHEYLKELAEFTQIPVANTLMGLGSFPGTHELSLGMLGMHGTYYANMAVQNSDLIVAIGMRFDDRVTGKTDAFAPNAKIIHIDIDPTSIRKNVRVDIPIVGDVSRVLQVLNKILKEEVKPQWKEIRQAWLKQINQWKKERPLTYEFDEAVIKPQYVIEKIYEVTKGDAIITTEVGQNQMWAAQFYKFDKPRRLVTSGGLGTMGYGFPAAIGAQLAFPDMTVIDIAGDGSIQMNIQELATAVIYNLPVKVAIINNSYLGMVRQWQEIFYGERYSHTYLSTAPDFVKVAESYGAVGLRATKPSEVEPVIKEALSIRKPVFMDFVVDWKEKVYPMVPPGAPIDQMIFEEKKKERKLKAVK
ncbi:MULTISPECIES: biosynthetic-type acetolactate synthase large subunit [Thermodesulfovibrio]|uniref:Acetolactate synthase n=2 Tax=Thermodesulfovibrio yellowstonii TaxID=28262 RepID=B5YFP1_THEYD|nr:MULTISPECIES: biosynthetic-type acetolactate synthase large subunit [Thermodesulfovibrio]ACI21111.1 acetolactate synthase, large subunit, biosynthetic type [Thermodesulfovibrio yellowstonii DSM 11347]MDI6864900.1 biosynthetic-type acetolactate synthase large subunit [Thermodesulfovibrio yellowstonii]GLI53317.1 acetolactate synthase [Thermodesulfovibrio islandicus]